jgi:DNA polymerase III sliding clamp (beta) subunit (PCNA family)
MKVKLNRKDSIGILDAVYKAVDAKNILPLYECFYFRIIKSKDKFFAFITATNETYSISAKCACDAEQEFEFCLEAKTFFNTIRLMSDDDYTLQLDLEKNLVIIKAGRKRYKLPYEDPQHFRYKKVSNKDAVTINGVHLCQAISNASGVIDEADVRVQFGVSYIESVDDSIVVTCVSNESITQQFFPAQKIKVEQIAISKTFSTALAGMPFKSAVSLIDYKNMVCFRGDGYEITGLKSDIARPEIEKILSNVKKDNYIIVDVEKISSALSRIKNYKAIEDKSFCTDIDVKGKILSIKAADVSRNKEALEDIDIKSEGVDLGIRVNMNLITRAFRKMVTHQVKIIMDTERKPIIIEEHPKQTLKQVWMVAFCYD